MHAFLRSSRGLCLGLTASALPLLCPSFSRADPVYAGEGIDMGHQPKSYIFHMTPIDIQAQFNETSWTQYWSSGLAVPGANLTGVKPDAQLVSRTSLIPLKPQSVTVTAEDNTTVTTLIDHQGTRTASMVTGRLFLVNPVNQQPVELAKMVNGVLTFPSNAVYPSNGGNPVQTGTLLFPSGSGLSSTLAGSLLLDAGYGNTLTAAKAVVLGGNFNRSTGEGSVIVGGYNYPGYENLAAGLGSTIIGSGASSTAGSYSSIIGGNGIRMQGVNSNYNHVLGGVVHTFAAGAGSYNAIVGGYGHKFESGGHVSFIGGGESHTIRNGGWRLATLGGLLNTLENVMGATLVGGMQNQIRNTTFSSTENLSVVAGGQGNVIQDVTHSLILGGSANQITSGWADVILAAQGGRASGNNQVVTGRYNRTDATKALIIGNGSSDSVRNNALTVDFNGNVEAAGTVKAAVIEVPSIRLTAPQGNVSMGAFVGP